MEVEVLIANVQLNQEQIHSALLSAERYSCLPAAEKGWTVYLRNRTEKLGNGKLKRDVSTFSHSTRHPGKLTCSNFMTDKRKNILTPVALGTNCLKVSPRPRAYQGWKQDLTFTEIKRIYKPVIVGLSVWPCTSWIEWVSYDFSGVRSRLENRILERIKPSCFRI